MYKEVFPYEITLMIYAYFVFPCVLVNTHGDTIYHLSIRLSVRPSLSFSLSLSLSLILSHSLSLPEQIMLADIINL